MAPIGIVHNPNARKNRGDTEKAGRLSEILGRVGIVRETYSEEDIKEVAREYLKRGIKILGINGGDGTQHRVISKFISVYKGASLPPVIHMRGGTMNTIANALNVLKGSSENILSRIVEKYRNNERLHTVDRQVMEIRRNPGPPSEDNQYGFMFGGGLVTSFLDAYYAGGDTGPWKAARVVYRAAASAVLRTEFVRTLVEPVGARVTADGEVLPFDTYTVIYASTLRYLGIGFKVTYRAEEKPGYFHCIAGDPSGWEIIARIPRLMRGRPSGLKSLHDDIHQTLVIDGRGPFSYTIDGELFTTNHRLTVTAGPTLKLITG